MISSSKLNSSDLITTAWDMQEHIEELTKEVELMSKNRLEPMNQ